MKLKLKIKFPVATLTLSRDQISIKNISHQQFKELHQDVEKNISGALKSFSNGSQEANYFFIEAMYLAIRKKLLVIRPYYFLVLPNPQARCFVKYFSQTPVSISTLEIIALLDQKLPILC